MHTPAAPGSGGDESRDRSLLRRAQRGEAPALAELMRHHLARAWRVCLTLTLDRDEAEALLIEVTRTFWSEALSRGPALDALTAIARLARAKSAMSTRRRAGEPGGTLEASRPDGRAFGEASPYDADYERRLLAVFASWSSEDRLLMALRAFERMPLAEVARALGLGATEPAERMAGLRVRLEASMLGEEPTSASGEHLSPLLLSASLDGSFAGALKDDGHEIVSRHLTTCAQCRDLSARLRRHEEGLRRLLAFDPGAAYLDDLARYLDQLIDAVAAGRHLPLRRVRAEVVEAPALLAATPVAEVPPAPVAEAVPPTAAPAPAPAPDVHATLDALMAELGKGFETPRTVTRAPVEPPRTAAEVMKPPSRELPRPSSREMPKPVVSEAAKVEPVAPVTPTPPAAPPPPPPVAEVVPLPTAAVTPSSAPRPEPRRRAADLGATIIEAHRSHTPPAGTPRPVLTPSVAEQPVAVAAAAPAPAPAPRPTERRAPPRVLVLALASALVGVIALYALPPVITVSMPDVPSPRLPRIEVVRSNTSTEAPPSVETKRAAPIERAPVATTATSKGTHPQATVPAPTTTTSRADRRTTESPTVARSPDAAPTAQVLRVTPPVAERRDPPPVAPATPETAPQVSTPAAAAAEPEEDWPLLCGEVRDESGEPVAGARVLLADLDLGARTDRRGRFCIAAPSGDRTLTVSAQGFAALRQLVSLGRTNAELALTLKTAP